MEKKLDCFAVLGICQMQNLKGFSCSCSIRTFDIFNMSGWHLLMFIEFLFHCHKIINRGLNFCYVKCRDLFSTYIMLEPIYRLTLITKNPHQGTIKSLKSDQQCVLAAQDTLGAFCVCLFKHQSKNELVAGSSESLKAVIAANQPRSRTEKRNCLLQILLHGAI